MIPSSDDVVAVTPDRSALIDFAEIAAAASAAEQNLDALMARLGALGADAWSV